MGRGAVAGLVVAAVALVLPSALGPRALAAAPVAHDAAHAVPRLLPTPGPASTYTPLSPPARFADTRAGGRTVDGRDAGTGALGPGATRLVMIGGRDGVPGTATAVAATLTVVGPTATTYLTVWPAGQPRPLASALDAGAHLTTAASVTVGLGAGGGLEVYNAAGATQVLVDVVGYFTTATTGGRLYPFPGGPLRVLDTRHPDPSIGVFGPLPGGSFVFICDNNKDLIGEQADVVTITAENPSGTGYLYTFPGTTPVRETTSVLPLTPHVTAAVSVAAALGPAPRCPPGELGFSIANASSRPTTLVVDFVGWYATSSTSSGPGLDLAPLPDPVRVVGLSGVGPASTLTVRPGAAPSAGALAVSLAAVATQPTYLALWPGTTLAPPLSSVLTLAPGHPYGGGDLVALSAVGSFALFNDAGPARVAVDVTGEFVPPPG